MEEADKDWMMIRMVGGWVFLLVPARPGSPGQRAVKRSLLLLLLSITVKFTQIAEEYTEWMWLVTCSQSYTTTVATRSTGTVHTCAKARLISVAIRIQMRDADRHQNLIICSIAHCQPSLKTSCKSVQKFLHKVANRQTDKQTNKQRRKHNLLGGGNKPPSQAVTSLDVLTCTVDALVYTHTLVHYKCCLHVN